MHATGMIYVVTGERGSGKSTVCARVAREAARRGLTVAGILTERRDTADLGSPRRVVDLRSGESRLFGFQDSGRSQSPDDVHQLAAPSGETSSAATSDPLTPGWGFDVGVFAWANDVFAHATPCDLLVVDEVGPLELLGGRGWVAALDVLGAARYPAALVVCRPGLVDELRERVGGARCAIVEVTPGTRDALPGRILEWLTGDQTEHHPVTT